MLSSVSRSLEPNRVALEDASFVREERVQARKTLCLKSTGTRNISTVVYDFVIIGYGNTGQSALRTLRETCPHARIALVDPLRSSNKKKGNNNDNGIDITTNTMYYRDTVVEFDPTAKSVRLLQDPSISVGYRHGVLIATGARGAPPPLELFQEAALSRVLELRPTELSKSTKRPMMAPEKVRKAVATAASRGAKIAILGSGWEALDLVLVAEKSSKSAKKKPPTLSYANQGIAWNILPSYLSTELRKKLSKRDIDLQDRSFVRYVADFQQQSGSNCQQLELHNAKTYDLLDTRRTILDLLVVAPDSFGDKGTAALPTPDVPDRMKESSDGRPWYKTWSQMSKTSNTEPSTVVCFEDDGRIAVNTELSVASKVYAAGSCAKYPNSSTGHSSIAGEGSIDGPEAGRVAALNMSREYRQIAQAESHGFVPSSGPSRGVEESHSFATNSLPVWRSDIPSYPTSNGDRSSALPTIGVQALCVGKCDSERQSTRAFWWTNSSARRKMKRFIRDQAEGTKEEIENADDDDEDDDDSVENGEASVPDNSNTSSSNNSSDKSDNVAINRRRSILISRQKSNRLKTRGLVNPIYGIGIVFYLDHYGRLQGIMTWGLPFADRPGERINPELLEQIKHLILTNAGVSALDAEENHQLMNAALGRASQKLVALAVKGHVSHMTRAWHGLDGPIEGFATPLYRYTEVSNSKNKTVNVLKRKDGSGLGVLGEGLYARDDFITEETLAEGSSPEDAVEEELPNNIPATMYPITVVPYSDKPISADQAKELNRFLAVQRWWETNENRARPGKEDPIWLRPGDERKNTSGKQTVIDAYRRIMFPHRSN
jgi:hypothetical protein